MSKSLKRVQRHLTELGLDIDILHVTVPTNTSQQAADAIGCSVNQIAKSVILKGLESGKVFLFLTAGGHRVDVQKASELAQEALGKADAAVIREQTGFAIGGVSPFGHLNDITTFIDPELLKYESIWAAAGTPHHMFDMPPKLLAHHSGAKLAEFTETPTPKTGHPVEQEPT